MRRLLLFFALAFAAFAFDAAAQSIGTAQFVFGDVRLERGGVTTVPARGTALRRGDIVLTGADGQIQMRMVDDALFALRPNSRLSLDEYRYTGEEGNSVVSLAYGVFRAFTGAIASRNRERISMRTPLATVGVRGSGNILAHNADEGTVNHTLTGAHSVTAKDAAGNEVTLVSGPGQTIQVFPGGLPRFVPAPSFIYGSAAASTTASVRESIAAFEEAAAIDALLELAAALESGELGDAIDEEEALAALQLFIFVALQEAQLPQNKPAQAVARFSVPGFGGRVGALIGTNDARGGDFFFDLDHNLVSITHANYTEFLSGPGALPSGFNPLVVSNAAIEFANGTPHEAFRNADDSVSIGRWQGGQILVTDADSQKPAHVIELGNTSVSYAVVTPTPAGIVESFTGTVSYTVQAATRPTDSRGNVGDLVSASLNANFTNRTADASVQVAVNNQNLTASASNIPITGANFGTGNAAVSCTGTNCASQGYRSAISGIFAGPGAASAVLDYRISPDRVSGGAFTDIIAGHAAMRATTPPTPGIILPMTGTTSLAMTDFIHATNAISLEATARLDADFTNRRVDFSMKLTGVDTQNRSGVINAAAAGMALVGVGFSADTHPHPNSTEALATVTCSGPACQGSAFTGRFDGYFTGPGGARVTVEIAEDKPTDPFYVNGVALFGDATPPSARRIANGSAHPGVVARSPAEREDRLQRLAASMLRQSRPLPR